ncbi:MAG: hypothetical protein GY943_23530, partial [Chloroflexi bacterium]|nr:hypothetical protein [Chloroflexota bacterium]
MDEMSVAPIHGTANGAYLFITQDCVRFYTSKLPEKDTKATWVPWKKRDHNPFNRFVANISDDKLRELIELLSIESEKMDSLNMQWLDVFTKYFGVAQPQTSREHDEFARKVNKHRKRKGPTWMEEAECQQLLDAMRPIIDEIERLKPQIDQSLNRVYGHLLVTDEDMGDE